MRYEVVAKGDEDLVVPKGYRKTKIEKLGNGALELVLKLFRKGYSYTKIASVLNESFKDKDIKPDDVSKVMKGNAKLMAGFIKSIFGNWSYSFGG